MELDRGYDTLERFHFKACRAKAVNDTDQLCCQKQIALRDQHALVASNVQDVGWKSRNDRICIQQQMQYAFTARDLDELHPVDTVRRACDLLIGESAPEAVKKQILNVSKASVQARTFHEWDRQSGVRRMRPRRPIDFDRFPK